MNRFNTAHAHALRTAMVDAREVLQKVSAHYQSAFELVMDTEGNSDGALAFRREGRDYAQALSAYNDATMTWLKFVDSQCR